VLVPKPSMEARTPRRVDCSPFPSMISPISRNSAQQLEITASIFTLILFD